MRCWLGLLALMPTLGLAQVPSPESVLGYRVGSDYKLADYKTIVGYFQKLDKASSRLKLRPIGKSTEGREMYVAEISSESNIRNLDRLLQLNAQLHDPRKLKDRKEVLARSKTVVLLSCSIHATEVAASQMSMELAYNLVSGNDPDIKNILDNSVVELIISANPDGLDMVKAWYDKNRGTKFESAPMPWLYQKYVGHDNNRDWWLISQKETENTTRYLYNVGFPTLLYDLHQMGGSGARFFVPPFFDPNNPNLDPTLSQSIFMLGGHMATDLAAAGKKGVLWSAIYDNWWQGGMRTTPQRHNIVAILSEAASAEIASPVEVKPESLKGHDRGLADNEIHVNYPDPWPGGKWTLRDIVDYEEISCMAVLRVGARYRDMWVKNQLEMSEREIELGKAEAPTAWLVPPQKNQEGVAQLIHSLMLGGIEVEQADEDLSVGELIYPKGTYILRCDQPYRAHLKDLMEIQRYPVRRLYPNGPVDRPYDVAGWTAPLMMNVETLQVGRAPVRSKAHRVEQLVPNAKANPLGTETPKVGLYQPYTASMDEGWTRFVWESYGVRYQTLHNADIRAGTLRARFDAIFLPGVSGSSIMNGVSANRMPEPYAGGIGKEGLEALEQFVVAGGTLVLMDESSSLAEQLGLPVKNALAGIGRDKFFCPGSILRTELDLASPLTAGMDAQGIAYFESSQAFDIGNAAPLPWAKQIAPRPTIVGRYAAKDVLLSGFLLGEEFLAGRPAIIDWTIGEGHIIQFGFPVQHRGQPMATFAFMWNAMKLSR